MAPVAWNGSQIIYNKVVRPVFLRHEAMVDDMVSSLGGKALNAAESLTREGAFPAAAGAERRPLAHHASLSSPEHPDEEQGSGDSSTRQQPDPRQEFTQSSR